MKRRIFLVDVQVDSRSDLQLEVIEDVLALFGNAVSMNKKNCFAYVYRVVEGSGLFNAIQEDSVRDGIEAVSLEKTVREPQKILLNDPLIYK